ncbi:MAG: carboxylating nicotinate-nucleotide diphosphorylase [Thiotrichales bacterium]
MHDLSTYLRDLERTVQCALAEDVGSGDVTAALIPADATAVATVVLRETALICGRPWFDATFLQLDPSLEIDWAIDEGSIQSAETLLCTLRGSARTLLTGERTALNFLQTLSGTATLTRRYADALAGSATRILDTRKTLPGLRLAQKYAVACGGGQNHRLGLYDQVLLKENHIAAAGSITLAVAQARTLYPQLPIEVETENLDEFTEALATSADIIMLDDYSHTDIAEAVRRNAGRKKLEISGGVTLANLAEYAALGVDYISSGALTKDVRGIDLSMRFSNR